MKHLKLEIVYSTDEELSENLRVISSLIKLGYSQNSKINYSFEVFDSEKPRTEIINGELCGIYQSKMNNPYNKIKSE